MSEVKACFPILWSFQNGPCSIIMHYSSNKGY